MLIFFYTNRTIRNMNIIRTDNGYCYYIDEFYGKIMLINPVIYNKFKGIKDSNIDSYYDSKISFFKKNIISFLQIRKKCLLIDYQGVISKNPLIILHNLIFEVTDRCNLSCEYCGYGKYYNNYDPRKKY